MSLPLANSFHQAAPIFDSGGINTESMSRPAISQTAAREITDSTLMLKGRAIGIGIDEAVGGQAAVYASAAARPPVLFVIAFFKLSQM